MLATVAMSSYGKNNNRYPCFNLNTGKLANLASLFFGFGGSTVVVENSEIWRLKYGV